MALPNPRQLFTSLRPLDRRIWLIAIARCINTMGFSLVMPFMAMYLVEEKGATGKAYGLIYLVAGIFSAASQGAAGEISDHIGRRLVMVLALSLRFFNMLGLGVAVVHGASIHVLGLLIVLNGALRALFEPCASAAVTDITPARHRVAAFALQRLGINLGWSIGPALGGVLAAGGSYGPMFFVAAPANLLAAIAILRVADRPRHPALVIDAPTPPLRDLVGTMLQHRVFLVYLLLVFVGSIMTGQFFSTFSVFTKTELGFPKGAIGLLFGINGLAVVLLQIPAVAFIEKKGPRAALMFGPTLYAIAFLGVGYSASFASLVGCILLITVGEVVFAPALADMAAHLGDPARMGRAFGLFGLVQSMGISLAPLVGGAVYDRLRHTHLAMWGVIAGGTALVGAGYALFARTVLPK